MNNKKGIVHLFLLIGVVLIGIIVIGYLAVKNRQIKVFKKAVPAVYSTQEKCEENTNSKCIHYLCDIPLGESFNNICTNGPGTGWYSESVLVETEPSTNSNDGSTSSESTSDWKTYRNEELGFEFRYPPDILIPSECTNGVNLYPADSKMPWSLYCNSSFIAFVYSNKEFNIEQINSSNFEITTKQMTIAGQKAIKQTTRKINKEAPGRDLTIDVQFKNDKYFMFTLKQKHLEDEFNQILSTFRFLDEKAVNAQLGNPFQLKIGQTANVTSENLSVKFTDITEDSRCPTDVTCVWEGQVTALVGISKRDENPIGVSLTHRSGHDELSLDTFGEYKIKLIKVDPYPTNTSALETSQYVASFIISKK